MQISSLALFITAPSISFSGAVAGELKKKKLLHQLHFPTSTTRQQNAKQVFLAPLPGRMKTSARGVSHAHPLLCFKFFFTLFLLASFYQKHKKFSILYSCYFFTLVHYVVP
jgi:hypothetical protein